MLGIKAGISLYDVKGEYKASSLFGGETTTSALKNHYDVELKNRVILNLTNSFGFGIEGTVSRGYLEFDEVTNSGGYRIINGGSCLYANYSLGLNLVFNI